MRLANHPVACLGIPVCVCRLTPRHAYHAGRRYCSRLPATATGSGSDRRPNSAASYPIL